MMVRLAKILIFTLITLLGCKLDAQENNSPDYEVYVDRIIKNFAEEMQKELSLVCIGSGGRMSKNIEEVSVKFIAYREASIKEARELEIRAIERLLKSINTNEKIRPYLNEFPFKRKNLEISISFQNPDNTHSTTGVAFIYQIRGIIYYDRINLHSGRLEDLAKETYEEALKVVTNKENIQL